MPHPPRGPMTEPLPVLSILIPASNEEALIGACLSAVLQSDWVHEGGVETVVISNGSQDRTAQTALRHQEEFARKSWCLRVLEREEGSKLGALNAGDRVARGAIRVYLDADVEISERLLGNLYEALDTPRPRYASGQLNLVAPRTWATRAYARIYAQVPFMTQGVPGAGLFAVNAAGRRRWGAFPDIISDDTFVRLSFRPEERVRVNAPYSWPLVEGWRNLVRVRRRQNAGVDEIKTRYPELLENDDKPPYPAIEKVKQAFRDPVGFAVYASVALAVRIKGSGRSGWSRGR